MKRIFISIIFLLITPFISHASITGFDSVNSYEYWADFSDSPTSFQIIEIDDTNASSSQVYYYLDSSCTDLITTEKQFEKIQFINDLYSVYVAVVWPYQAELSPLCLSLYLYDSNGDYLTTYTRTVYDDPDYFPLFNISSTTVNTVVTTEIQVNDTSSESLTYAIYSFLVLASFILGFIITAWTLHLYTA